MEFDTKPGNVAKQANNILDNTHTINLYRTAPHGQLTLEECEDLFRQRLEALAIIEKVTDMSNTQLSVTASALREIKSYVYKTNCILLRAGDPQQRKLDHYSHMLARLYCVYEPSLWNWFRTCEKRLLYYRLRDHASSLSGTQLESILKSFNFDFVRVSGPELTELYRDGVIGWVRRDNNTTDHCDIFKVKFVDALKFVAKRSVSLKDGYAFLTRHEITSVVCDVFEKHLDHELIYARQHLNIELPQTQQLIESLRMVYVDYEEKMDEEKRRLKREQEGENRHPYSIDVEDIEDLKKKHFPPCMRYIHDSLLEDHHLRHSGRLYFGTFLRSGGVDMETAIEFWRKEFTKKIANDKFERDYKYNIRHLYGREGHKKALTCFSCDKIINDNAPGPADKHGCPFKHFDEKNLKSMLTKHELSETDIDTIMMLKTDKEYKMACSNYFKFRKGEYPTEPIKNPIHFYFESMRHARMPPKEDWDESMQDLNESLVIPPDDAVVKE